ncbi:hypothetical protein GTU99_02435 [Streptomyces sp. PRKS01-65]|nr:T3SS effector HopA1 family protein [Streptomyces harenosi]NEY31073.1 hypothetical protein [Streptomyces harenosi]
MTALLSARLEEALAGVRVEPDGRTAFVGERMMTAPTPRALTGQLANALYEVVHVGRSPQDPDRPDRTAGQDADRRPDGDLEDGLAARTPHPYSHYRAPVLDAAPEGRGPVVRLSGVRVRVAPDRITGGRGAAGRPGNGAEAGVLVAAVRRSLSPGFFLVDGSRPLTGQDRVLRVYLHVGTPGAVLDAWEASLRCLEGHGVPYRAKALSSSAGLPRRDGVVIYLGGEDQYVLPGLLDAVGRHTAPTPGTSPFTRPLAPGVAVAWEPDDPRPGGRNTSLGEHRSRALAEGLVRHATRAGDGGGSRSEVVRKALLEAGIDPMEPARNLSSPPFQGGF